MGWRAELSPYRLQQLWYIPLLSLAMGLMFVRTLIIASLLEVDGFGQFSAGLLISSTFCMLACLGLQPILHRDLPVLIERRRIRYGLVLLTQCVIVACACAAAGAIAALSGVSIAGFSADLFLAGLIHGLSQQLFLIATVESRSRGQPLRFSRQNLFRALIILVFGACVAYWTQSAVLTLIAEAVISLLIAHRILAGIYRAASVHAALMYKTAFRRLANVRWRSALALLLVSIVGFLLLSADRWVAAQSLASEQFAQYAFAWTVLMIAQSVQLMVSASVFPLLARRYAAVGKAAAYRLCLRVSCGLLLAGAALGLPSWLILEAGIQYAFQDYRPALALVPLFVAVAVLRISDFWTSFIIIVGFEGRLLALNILAGAFGAAIWLLWVQPWQGPALGLLEIGLLAALLSACSYMGTAVAAWRTAEAELS
jgi:O-antigen/teichoic acid export membrane protein